MHRLNKMTNKTKFMYFGKSKRKLEINIQRSKTNQSDCIKYLDLYFNNKLKWHEHIDFIEFKLSAATDALYNLHKYVSQTI